MPVEEYVSIMSPPEVPGKRHHVWCNSGMKDGPCKHCDRYYRLYPYINGDNDPTGILERYFPNVIVKN